MHVSSTPLHVEAAIAVSPVPSPAPIEISSERNSSIDPSSPRSSLDFGLYSRGAPSYRDETSLEEGPINKSESAIAPETSPRLETILDKIDFNFSEMIAFSRKLRLKYQKHDSE